VVTTLALPLIVREWNLTMVQAGAIATAMLLGAGLGGFIFGPIADRYGRKKGLMWCIAFFSVTTGFAGLAENHLQLTALRFIAGLGLGAEWALGATMLAEFFPAEQRGKASSWMMIGWPIGYFIAIGVQAWRVPVFGWRALFFAGTSGMLVAIFIWLFVPESPVWLRAQENKMRGIETQPRAAAPKLTDLLKPVHIRTTLLTSTICLCALMTYWALNTWLPMLLVADRGLNMKGVVTYLIMFNVGNVIGFLVGGHIGDRVGKRRLIITSALLSAVMFYVWLGMTRDLTLFLWLGVLYHAVGSVFWATLPAFLAEQFPTHIRAFGVASSYSLGRFIVVIVPMALGAAAMKTGLTAAIAFMAIFYVIAMFATFMLRDNKILET
jgi:MFS family permease